MDKCLKLFSYQTVSVELSIDLPAAGWSCCFDESRDHIVYAGLSNCASICVYDTRNPKQVINTLSDPSMGGVGKGVHSLQHVEEHNCLIGGSLASPFLLEHERGISSGTEPSCVSGLDSFSCVEFLKGEPVGVWQPTQLMVAKQRRNDLH
ncbi:hypothetical protein BC830DRAFT_217056 [Chytriomyces sp. MP71]|nr:hypothetical protein BC830DRAFT_217056 [Chytriomyces sp. MP71]